MKSGRCHRASDVGSSKRNASSSKLRKRYERTKYLCMPCDQILAAFGSIGVLASQDRPRRALY